MDINPYLERMRKAESRVVELEKELVILKAAVVEHCDPATMSAIFAALARESRDD